MARSVLDKDKDVKTV